MKLIEMIIVVVKLTLTFHTCNMNSADQSVLFPVQASCTCDVIGPLISPDRLPHHQSTLLDQLNQYQREYDLHLDENRHP